MSTPPEYDENDDETALFLRECMSEKVKNDLRRLQNHEPYPVEVNLDSLRALVKRHNEAMRLLREFLEMHPEETALTRRARRLASVPRASV